MEIDPFTVGAQILNFVVLVALLKRFLYGPVLRAMAEREARISTELADAAQSREDAAAEAERMRARNAELEAAQDRLMQEVRADVEARRTQLLLDAREEIERQREHWRDAVERERDTLLEELQRRVVEHVHAALRRALRDLADEDLERAVARAFLRRLADLDPEQWARAAPRAEDDGPPSFLVASAFPLPEQVRGEIEAQVRAHAGADALVRYEVRPETIAGVQLETRGLRTAWSLADFVDSLEELLPPDGAPAAEVPAP